MLRYGRSAFASTMALTDSSVSIKKSTRSERPCNLDMGVGHSQSISPDEVAVVKLDNALVLELGDGAHVRPTKTKPEWSFRRVKDDETSDGLAT